MAQKENLAAIGGNKRAPLKITLNNYTYQSTATVMDGKCLVVFPTRDREASGVKSGDTIDVTLELDAGYRQVDVPEDLALAVFDLISYYRKNDGAVNAIKRTDTTTMQIEYISDTSLPSHIRRVLDLYIADYT